MVVMVFVCVFVRVLFVVNVIDWAEIMLKSYVYRGFCVFNVYVSVYNCLFDMMLIFI